MCKHAADQECNNIECNEILLNASKCTRMQQNAVSNKLHHTHFPLLSSHLPPFWPASPQHAGGLQLPLPPSSPLPFVHQPLSSPPPSSPRLPSWPRPPRHALTPRLPCVPLPSAPPLPSLPQYILRTRCLLLQFNFGLKSGSMCLKLISSSPLLCSPRLLCLLRRYC